MQCNNIINHQKDQQYYHSVPVCGVNVIWPTVASLFLLTFNIRENLSEKMQTFGEDFNICWTTYDCLTIGMQQMTNHEPTDVKPAKII